MLFCVTWSEWVNWCKFDHGIHAVTEKEILPCWLPCHWLRHQGMSFWHFNWWSHVNGTQNLSPLCLQNLFVEGYLLLACFNFNPGMAVFRAKLKKLLVLIRILREIQALICKEMCKKLMVLTKSCRSLIDGPALVCNTAAWINNHMPSKVWDEITYLVQSLKFRNV